MKTSSAKVIRKLHKLWPDLIADYDGGNLWIADSDYWLITEDELKWVVKESPINEYRFVNEGFDCDDFALLFHSHVVEMRYEEILMNNRDAKKWYPWALGQVWGTKFQGKKTTHAINICLTKDEGIMLIEPQTDEIWKADPEQDEVFFIRM